MLVNSAWNIAKLTALFLFGLPAVIVALIVCVIWLGVDRLNGAGERDVQAGIHAREDFYSFLASVTEQSGANSPSGSEKMASWEDWSRHREKQSEQ